MAPIRSTMTTLFTSLLALSTLGSAVPFRHAHPSWNRHGRPDRTDAIFTLPTATPTPTSSGVSSATSSTIPSSSSNPSGSANPNPSTNNTGTSPTDLWTPAPGTTWQIILSQTVSTTSLTTTVDLYDIDLFDNPASTITTIHESESKVICYFSAGTYEDWRDDAADFQDSDLGDGLDDWEGENWVDLRSDNVRSIMAKRLDLAAEKGCDGVDPDNVDAYGNGQGGIGLTEDDSVDFMNWLASESHSRGLSIGLKNAGDIVPRVIGNMQWSVNEQCAEYDECDVYTPFLRQGKPVFHIEYPEGERSGQTTVSSARKASACQGQAVEGFSTLMKNMDLDEWVQTC